MRFLSLFFVVMAYCMTGVSAAAGSASPTLKDRVFDFLSQLTQTIEAQASRPPQANPTRAPSVARRNFANAKKILPRVFSGMEEDFYCGCRYQGKQVDLASCGYIPRKNAQRAARIEWEHVVPAWVIGHQRQCWQQGGRRACTRDDAIYALAEGDLVNLVPAIGEVNGDRAHFPYRVWTRDVRPMYGSCQTIIDFKAKRVQPREAVRGRIARITLYMHTAYQLSLSPQERHVMCAWARLYPVDAWERERERRIVRWQGHGNPLVSDATQLARVCPARAIPATTR